MSQIAWAGIAFVCFFAGCIAFSAIGLYLLGPDK